MRETVSIPLYHKWAHVSTLDCVLTKEKKCDIMKGWVSLVRASVETPNLLLYHEMARLSSAKFYLTKAWRCGIMGRARGRAHVSCEKIVDKGAHLWYNEGRHPKRLVKKFTSEVGQAVGIGISRARRAHILRHHFYYITSGRARQQKKEGTCVPSISQLYLAHSLLTHHRRLMSLTSEMLS